MKRIAKVPKNLIQQLKEYKDTADFFRNSLSKTKNDMDNAAQYDEWAAMVQRLIDGYKK
jgi:hypothetical protein